MFAARIESVISKVKGACSDDCATVAPSGEGGLPLVPTTGLGGVKDYRVI